MADFMRRIKREDRFPILQRWKFATTRVGLVSVFICLSANSLALDEVKSDQQAASRKVLIEARDAFLEDGAGKKVQPRALQYIYMREGIEHSPLLPIAVMLGELDDLEAVATAELIEELPWRAYALVRIADAHVDAQRAKTAQEVLERAVKLIKQDGFDPQGATQLWPIVAGVLLRMHGDIDAAKKAAAKLGCPWDSLDREELQFELAKFHVNRGNIEAARKALAVLPEDTFTNRKARQSIRNDDGAGLYLWSQQPASAYTADHVLLEWLHNSDDLESIEKLLQKLPDDDMRKLSCYLSLAKQFHQRGDAERSKNALKRATQLADAHKDKAIREALEADLLAARLPAEGNAAVQAIRESGVLEKHKDKPWIAIFFQPLLDAGEIELVEQLTKDRKPDNSIRNALAIAMTKAGRIDDALAQAKQVQSPPFGEPSILLGMALQQSIDGDSKGAKRTWRDAVTKADKVPSTNEWFPSEGRVRHQQKWLAMNHMLVTGIRMGFVDEALARFSGGNASIRQIAHALAKQGKDERLRQWIESFDKRAREEGARCFALLGMAEGLMAK